MEITSIIKGGFLLALLILFSLFTYDVYFAPPKIHQGIVLNKVFVPQHSAVGNNVTSYGKNKAYKYIVQSHKNHQWIAIVRTDDNDTLKVHCSSKHFEISQVGDTLLFKEYKGAIFGIDYLAHSEEDTIKTDFRLTHN